MEICTDLFFQYLSQNWVKLLRVMSNLWINYYLTENCLYEINFNKLSIIIFNNFKRNNIDCILCIQIYLMGNSGRYPSLLAGIFLVNLNSLFKFFFYLIIWKKMSDQREVMIKMPIKRIIKWIKYWMNPKS